MERHQQSGGRVFRQRKQKNNHEQPREEKENSDSESSCTDEDEEYVEKARNKQHRNRKERAASLPETIAVARIEAKPSKLFSKCFANHS